MDRAAFECPACRAVVPAPRSLAGRAAPCPRCRAAVARWPEPRPEPGPAAPPPPAVAPSRAPAGAPAAAPGAASGGATGGGSLAALAALAAALAAVVAGATGVGHLIDRARAADLELENELRQVPAAGGYYLDAAGQVRLLDPAAERVRLDRARAREIARGTRAAVNVAVAAGFVAAAFGAAAAALPRGRSAYRAALAAGGLAGGTLGTVGAAASQFAPLVGGTPDPFTLAQLGGLMAHTLAFGLAGVLVGVSVGRLRGADAG